MKTTRYLFFTLLALFSLSVKALQHNILQVPDVTTQIGEFQLPVKIENTDEIVGIQFDFALPDGVTAGNVGILSNRSEDHIVTVNKLNNGVYRVLLYSPQNRPLRGQSGIVMYLPVILPASFEEGSEHSLTVTNVTLAKSTGENVLTEIQVGKICISKLPDLIVNNITCNKQVLNPGENVVVAWQIENIGGMPTNGGWSEQISFIGEDGIFSKQIASTHYDGFLDVNGIISRQIEVDLPVSLGLDGDIRLQVRIIPDIDAGESIASQGNNTQLGTSSLNLRKALYLELPQVAIDENTSSPVRCKLSRSGSWAEEETFTLTKTEDDRLEIPASVTISKGQSGTYFYVNLVDNEVLDNDTAVTVSVSGNGYEKVSGKLLIEDNEFPTLTVKASQTEINEGETFQLVVAASRVSDFPTSVTLTCENKKRFSYPTAITIPAGETSTTIDVTAIDNSEIELRESIAFKVSSEKYNSGECIVLLGDNDMPTLIFTLSPNAVSEADGTSALFGIIKRTDNLDKRVVLKLSDDYGLLSYTSQTVIMEKNQAEVQFNIGVTNNDIVDGERTATVSAAVYSSSCDCSIPNETQSLMSSTVTIIDDDGATLKIKPEGTAMLEGSDENVFIVSHNTKSDKDIPVRISSDKDDILEYEHELIIPAGQTSAKLVVKVNSNDIQDDSNIVTFNVESDGYSKGTCWILITDQTLPDAVVSLSTDKSEVEAEQTVLLRAVVKNVGNSTLHSATPIQISFGGSRETINLNVGKSLAVGDSAIIEYNYALPSLTGNYTFEAIVNAEKKVQELIYANNTSNKVAIRLLSPYNVTAQVDRDTYAQNDSVVITGTATGNAGKNAQIEVYLINENSRQTIRTTSDAAGNYSIVWKPLSKQSGHFIVGACYPGSDVWDEMDAFDVYGVRAKDNFKTCELSQTESISGKIILTNPGNLAQIGLTITPASESENCEFSFDAPSVIGAGESIEITYTVKANEISEGSDWQQMPIEISTAEGAHLKYIIYYYVHSLRARLETNKTYINTTMTYGTPREYPITIRNIGKGETGKITLALPGWIQAVTPTEMSSLAQGDSTTVLLRFIPTEEMKLNVRVSGRIGINCANGDGTAISFNLTPVSEEKGKLKIDVVDEYTYFTTEAPHVSNAKVQVKNPSTNEIVAEGLTSEDGTFLAELPVGYYSVTVDADKHDSYANTVIVDPGVEKNEEAFLSYQAITYSWNVEETSVEDEYEIETIVKYETRVPKPVVIITLPDEQPEPNSIIPVILTNKGLVNAVDVNLSLSINNGYKLEFLNDPTLEVLAPQQSHVFYAKMVPEADDEVGAKVRKSSSRSKECYTLIARAKYKELCKKYAGEELAEQIKKWGTRECLSSNTSSGSGGSSSGGSSSNGPGRPGSWRNTSYDDIYKIWDTDDPAKFCDDSFKNNGEGGNGDNGSGGNGSGGNNDTSPDENDPVPSEEPEETDCDDEPVIEFIVAEMSGKYSRNGLAADGESKVKIILDGSKSKFPGNDCPEFTPIGWHLDSDDRGTLEQGDSWKEAIYTAPDKFDETWDASKEVKAVFTYSYKGQNYTCEKSFALIRVPVVFVHGLNSDPSCWKKMKKYLTESNKYSKIHLSTVDYKKTHNNRYSDNYPIVMSHITSTLDYYKKHYGYEISLLDVVGHSMGGLLTKKVIQTNSSIGIRKLITINTPHGGSQLGNFLLNRDVQYVRDLPIVELNDLPSPVFRIIPNKYEHKGARRALRAVYWKFAPSDNDFDNGAVANLSVGCNAINDINFGNTSSVKCHAVICNSNNEINLGLPLGINVEVSNVFGYMFSAFGYSSSDDAFKELFYNDKSDAIVPLKSQKGGLNTPCYSLFEGGGEFSHISSCDNSTVQNRVLNLLLAPSESSVFSDGFNATPPISFDMPQLNNIYSIYPPSSKSARPLRHESQNNETDYQLVCKYIQEDNALEVSINKTGLINVEISAYIDKNLIFIDNTADARIPLPVKYVGEVEIICDASDENGNSLAAREIVDVDGINEDDLTSIQFDEEEYVIFYDLSISPRVLCNWSDSTTSYLSNFDIIVHDPSICSLADNGSLIGKKTGSTIITAKYGNYECSVPISVYTYNNVDDIDDSPSICSTVTLSFKQKNVMTRQAFRGTLTVNNGNETMAMKDVKMNLEVRDMDGNLTTSHEFQIDAESLNGFTGNLDFNSGWTLGAGETGSATIIFIPTKYAAPTEPKDYSFGGSFSYTDPYTGLTVTRDLNPVTLTVNPSPNLEMTYFMQRDVFGDDPLTETVEPMIPSEFALIVNNKGYGDAENMSLTTHQPMIIDNQKGLAISFEQISAQLNGNDKNLSLGCSMTSDFGTIPAHSQAYAQWWLQSSLLGHFIEYNVKATHLTSRNNPDLSLLDTVTIHELIHGFTVKVEEDRPLRGFLVNDIKDKEDLPDEIYFTDATQQGVYMAAGAHVQKLSDTEYLLNVNVNAAGWNYGSLIDPTGGKQKLVQVLRSDGAEVFIDNIWQTDRTLRDGKDPLYENLLHFIGDIPSGGETFYLTFEPKPELELEVEAYVGVPDESTVLQDQLREVIVRFNKPIKSDSFTFDDLVLNSQGLAQDVSLIGIEKVSEQEYRLLLNEVTLLNGYYVLTVQTAGIEDNEGFNGVTGKQATWIQFADGKVTLKVSASPVDGGTVTPKTGLQDYGTTVALTATPAEGFDFLNWTRGGEVLATTPDYELRMEGDAEVVAMFTRKHYDVTIVCDETWGTVTGGGTGIYDYGTVLTLTAEPQVGYTFVGWNVNGEMVDALRTWSDTVRQAMTIEPLFAKIEKVTVDYEFQKGWNWFSVNVADDKLDDVPTLLAPIETVSVILLGQTEELVNDPVYGWLGTLESLSPQRAYKLQVEEPVNLSLTGRPLGVDGNTITLESGWNWVGYLPQMGMTVNDALRNMVATTNDVVKGQDAFAMYDGTAWVGSLETMEPGNGYLFYSQGVKSFNYPSAPLAHARSLSAPPATWDIPEFWSYDPHRYADNMSIVAQLQGAEKSGRYLMAAFVEDECRGVATECRGYQFITVHHDAVGQTVRFKALDKLTGVIYDLNETASYQSGTLGNFKTPMNLSLGATSITPVSDDLYLKVSGNTIHFYGDIDRIRLVRIIGANGSVLKQIEESPADNKVDISALSAGVYIVTVNTDEGIIQKKVVKK